MQTLFVFRPSVDHLDNEVAYDIVLDNFPDSNSITPYLTSKKIELDKDLVFTFRTKLDNVEERDFLHSNVGWPIVSKRLYDILLETETPHIKFDVKITSKNNQDSNNYYALQILPEEDMIILEDSSYEEDTIFPGEILYFNKVVFNKFGIANKPIFRPKELNSYLIINRELKSLLEQANIQGIQIIDVDKFNWFSGI